MKDQDLVKPDGIDRVIDYLVGNYGEIQRAWKRVAPEDQTLEKYPAWALRHLLASPWSRRFGKEEEISELVAFMVSEQASFLVGSILLADGGQGRVFQN